MGRAQGGRTPASALPLTIKPESSNVSTAPTRPEVGSWGEQDLVSPLRFGSCSSITARSPSKAP